jgi:hypothetical protein
LNEPETNRLRYESHSGTRSKPACRADCYAAPRRYERSVNRINLRAQAIHDFTIVTEWWLYDGSDRLTGYRKVTSLLEALKWIAITGNYLFATAGAAVWFG